MFDPGPAPKPPDWTVLIALVVSVTGFALLMLLIYGIVFCYKRRKGEGTFHSQLVKRLLGLSLTKFMNLTAIVSLPQKPATRMR